MAQIKLRRDTYQNWYDANPILANGEPAFDITNTKIKIGDGTNNWRSLSYLTDATGGSAYSDSNVATLLSSGSVTGISVNGGVSATYFLGSVANGQSSLDIPAIDGNVVINVGANAFIFGTNGNFTLPQVQNLHASPAPTLSGIVFSDGTTQYTAYTGLPFNQVLDDTSNVAFNSVSYGARNVRQLSSESTVCSANVDTIIYVTYPPTASMKLVLRAEGTDDNSNFSAQTCEMSVARAGTTVAGSVYGLVYTSPTQLATFNVRWNATSSSLEVTCRPTSTTNSVNVLAAVTELYTSLP